MSADHSRIVVDIVVFSIISMAAANDKCEHKKVGKCVEDMRIAMEENGHSVVYNNQQRNNVCQGLKKFKTCIDETHCQKLEVMKPVYEGFTNGLEFVCNDSYHTSESVVACRKVNGFDAAQSFCSNGTTNDMSCTATNDMLSCITKSVKHCCSQEAADYINKSLVLTFGPTLTAQSCTPNTDKDVVTLKTCEAPIADTTTSPGVNVGFLCTDVVTLQTCEAPIADTTTSPGVNVGLLVGIIIFVFTGWFHR